QTIPDYYIATPLIDLGAHEPEPSVVNDTFPASFVKVVQSDFLGRRHSSVNVISGQTRPGPGTSSINRLVNSVSGDVTYAPASVTDFTSPRFVRAGEIVSGGNGTFYAPIADEPAIRVRA